MAGFLGPLDSHINKFLHAELFAQFLPLDAPNHYLIVLDDIIELVQQHSNEIEFGDREVHLESDGECQIEKWLLLKTYSPRRWQYSASISYSLDLVSSWHSDSPTLAQKMIKIVCSRSLTSLAFSIASTRLTSCCVIFRFSFRVSGFFIFYRPTMNVTAVFLGCYWEAGDFLLAARMTSSRVAASSIWTLIIINIKSSEPNKTYHNCTCKYYKFKQQLTICSKMIVTDKMSRIDAIIESMRNTHAQTSRALKGEWRSQWMEQPESNGSFKTSKDSTLAYSKQPEVYQQPQCQQQQNKENREECSNLRMETLNQNQLIEQQSEQQDQSHQQPQSHPLKHFISPNNYNWLITNSRNQSKSPFNLEHEPECASFRHIQEEEERAF